jgi:transglutaminase-like putative cysteine protease
VNLQNKNTFSILHDTEYLYQRSVSLSQQLLHMTPRDFGYQHTLSHQIEVEPKPSDWSERINYFGNPSKIFAISIPHKRLHVRAQSTLVLQPRLTLEQIVDSMPWEAERDSLHLSTNADSRAISQFVYESPHVLCSAELAAYATESFRPGCPLLDAALDLTQRIFCDFEFDGSATTISTPLSAVLKGRRGVCQDFAHLMIGCLRTLGIACRYVSGYILTTPPEGQPRMIGADASHAWVSVYCIGYGWVDFDPTNHCLVQDEHITVGWGRDFSDVTPMRGVILGGGTQELKVSVTVTPLN